MWLARALTCAYGTLVCRYGIMFALVAGMMVYIAACELLPTALRYDPANRFTTRGLVFGMAVMAASLLLFSAT